MTEIPEKNRPPQAQPSAQPATPAIVKTIATVLQTQWTQLRPTAVQTLKGLTQTLQQWSQQLESQEKTAQARGESTAQPIDWTPLQRLASTFWAKTQPLWQTILNTLRPKLPAVFQPLDDRTLSGIFAGTLLLVLWFFSLIPSGQATPKPLATPETRSVRSTQPQPIREVSPRRTQLSRDYNQNYDNSSDDSIPVAIPERLSTPTKPKAFSKTQSDPTASPITSASPSADLPTAEAPPRPKPEILSPDAQKRTKLRQDLDVIASSLVDSAIVGIRPQFTNHTLTITLSDRWYSSPEVTQDKLANSLLVIAQGRGLTQLQLESTDGTLLARSPVVGEGMVVVQRIP